MGAVASTQIFLIAASFSKAHMSYKIKLNIE